MSRHARNRRRVERGHNNAPTVAARNRKAEKQFGRWWRSQLVQRVNTKHARGWQLQPTGHGLIHKGRKP